MFFAYKEMNLSIYDFLEPKPLKRPMSAAQASSSTDAFVARKKIAISIGGDGLALEPFAASHKCVHVEHVEEAERVLFKHQHDNIDVIFAFLPCTNLVPAGARWWESKKQKDPEFQTKEVAQVKRVHHLLRSSGASFCLMCPPAPLLKKQWRSPNAIISPHEYGQYLNISHIHPTYSVVPDRDAYIKKTYCYVGNGFVLPQRKPVKPHVETVHRKGVTKKVSPLLVRRKDKHVKHLTPLGLTVAVAEQHNKNLNT